MITNDTNFLLAMLEGRDAREVATAFLAILLLAVLAVRIRKSFNRYITSRLRHIETEAAERQKLAALIENVGSLSAQVSLINEKLDSANLELLQQKKESNDTKINELRDRLLQGFRYYTSASSNPSHSWNEMEADAFWEMFWDYENRGGDGYMHTDVEPAMRRLPVTKLFNELNE